MKGYLPGLTMWRSARMIADAEAGLIDVVLLHKIDRFARSMLVALQTFKRLEAVGVSFVSISEKMDFSTPMGRAMLANILSFAQLYSDNLSWETKKGKAERKRQGMYNGILPFGTVKGDDGVPGNHPTNYAGLVFAFTLAAEGRTDREIAQALNEAGYRTSGNRGANPFTKDTVRQMLQNRFYLGELPLDDGTWMQGKHLPVLDVAVFDRAHAARMRNVSRPRRVATTTRQPWSLSGVAQCSCGGYLNSSGSNSRQRIACSSRTQGLDCVEPSLFADHVDQQIAHLLGSFEIDQKRAAELTSTRRRKLTARFWYGELVSLTSRH